MAKKTKIIIVLTNVLLVSSLLLMQSSVMAAVLVDGGGGGGSAGTPTTSSSPACDNTTPSTVQDCVTQSPIVKDINQIVNFLGALVGIVVVGVIIMGGIQYSMAGDNPSALSAAKQRIINGLIALVAFMLTYAFVQWLVPGGVFG